jgi:hypothetical protein
MITSLGEMPTRLVGFQDPAAFPGTYLAISYAGVRLAIGLAHFLTVIGL